MEFYIDSAGKHTVSLRGTLAGNNNIQTPAAMPGQDASNVLLNNSRGLAALYTAVLRPSLINVFTFGLTRVGLQQTGPAGTAFTLDSVDPFTTFTRGYVRIAPTYNFVDKLTWNKGTHTITTGLNFQFVRDGISNYANSCGRFGFSRGNLTLRCEGI